MSSKNCEYPFNIYEYQINPFVFLKICVFPISKIKKGGVNRPDHKNEFVMFKCLHHRTPIKTDETDQQSS